jgi:adenosylcobinamide-GDP ribazoletransferase
MFRRIAASISIFTRIPIARWITIGHSYYGETAPFYPIVGWLAGGLAALVFYLADYLFTQPVTVAITLTFSVFFTGGLQEGGLAYFFDNLGGRHGQRFYYKNRVDKAIGIQGILGVALALILQFAILQETSPALVPWIILSGESLSRLMAITLVNSNRYLRPKEGYNSAPQFKNLGVDGWLIALVLGFLPFFITLRLKVWVAILPLVGVRIVMGFFFKRFRGGVNFEEFLATQQFCLIAFYLGVAAIPNI